MSTVVEIFEERTAGTGPDGRRYAVRVFLVQTNSGSVGAAEVLRSTGIPTWGDKYVSSDGQDEGLWVSDLQAREFKAHDIWRVTVKYENRIRAQDGSAPGTNRMGNGGLSSLGGAAGPNLDGGGVPSYGTSPPAAAPELVKNPLLRPPQISWGTGRMMRVAEVDNSGNAIVNKAKLPFDPPLEREEFYPTLTVTKNQARYDALDMDQYKGAVNSAVWMGKAVRTWRCEDITATQEIEEGVFFWRVTYQLAYKSAKWDVVVLNAGTWELDATGNNHLRIKDSQGNFVSRAYPLNNSGRKIAVSGGAFAETPIYLTFRIYTELDFKNLKLFKPGG